MSFSILLSQLIFVFLLSVSMYAQDEVVGMATEIFAPDLYTNADVLPLTLRIDGMTVKNPVIYDQYIITEGDIIITTTHSLQSIEVESRHWNCPVPFIIDSSLSSSTTARILAAIQHWEDNTDWRFVERTTEEDYLIFVESAGCASFIGRIGNAQKIFMSSSCSLGNIVHEIGHAIGLYHEHTRTDRDEFLTIITENIAEGAEGNFEKREESNANDVGGYDLGSIMHYSTTAFSDPPGSYTILVDPTIRLSEGVTVGQRDGLSAGDILGGRSRMTAECQMVVQITAANTMVPTARPSETPTMTPTSQRKRRPTAEPTAEPTTEPTTEPTYGSGTHVLPVCESSTGRLAGERIDIFRCLDFGECCADCLFYSSRRTSCVGWHWDKEEEECHLFCAISGIKDSRRDYLYGLPCDIF